MWYLILTQHPSPGRTYDVCEIIIVNRAGYRLWRDRADASPRVLFYVLAESHSKRHLVNIRDMIQKACNTQNEKED